MTECSLHRVHHPSVAVLHDVVFDNETVRVCGTGRDNLAACIAYLSGGTSPAAKLGKETWDLAQRIHLARKVRGL